MKVKAILLSGLCVAAVLSLHQTSVIAAEPQAKPQACPAYLDQDFRKLHSKDSVNLCKAFAGRPLLIVNTASHCGFTPQFKGLEAVNTKYVRGPEANPVFRELARQTQAPGWNFNKYLVQPDGKVAQYFDSKVTPESQQFSDAVEKVLK